MWDAIGLTLKILIGVIATLALGRLFFFEFIPMIKEGIVENRVREKGVAVNADIIAAHQTSAWGGNKPIYLLTFRFVTEDNVQVESSLSKALTFEEIEKFKPGNGTTIKYDPKDPKKIALYDKPLIFGDHIR
ncbi:DUF3592 domain-containing protein [Superficieibacter sp.]|uniref:DUF3592 domain-containing protein n=1 Tax=Superficieibacter sp. TaxID=2303322 RepID=UPI0028AEACB5|nr:DUF3592 domain-containing protein [Superficieibacter sp.]